jgi:MFS family permease
MSALAETTTGNRRPPMALIFAVTVTGILANTLILAPLPDILDDFEKGAGQAGILVASGTLPGVLMAPVIGILADRWGRRAVLVPCLAVFGIAGTAAAFAPSFEALLLLRLAQGFGAAGLINLAVVLIGDFWTGIERARIVGYNAAVLTVSLVIFPSVGGVLAQLGGWRWAFAPFPLALVTAVLIAVRLPGGGGDRSVSVGDQVGSALRVVRQPVILASIGFGFVLFVLIFGLFLTTMPIHLEEKFGLGPAARGLVVSVPALGSTVAALSIGSLRARFGGRRLVIVATMLFTIAFAVIGLAPWLAILLGGAILYGFGEGGSIPTVQDFVTGGAPDESRGAVVAFFVSAVRAGQTVGPLIAGVTIAAVGTGETFLLGAAVAGGLLVAEVFFTRPGSDVLPGAGRH